MQVFLKLLLGCLILILMAGCPTPDGTGIGGDDGTAEPSDRYFWTINTAKDYKNDPSAWIEVGANLVEVGTNCLIYLENGKSVSDAVIADIASEFDTTIWNIINTNFASPTDRDGNGKVILFLLDIRDSYNPTSYYGYVGGYFYIVDLLTNSELLGLGYPAHIKSNEGEILYIDINPNDPSSIDCKSTVVHEFQHLVCASCNVIDEGGDNLPAWIDEGFSMVAEAIYQGVHLLPDREEWYDYDPLYTGAYSSITPVEGESIAEGYPLVLWNIYPSNGYAIYNDYALSHLFFAWLRIHMGNDSFFKEIHYNSTLNNVDDVIDVCKNYGPFSAGSVDTFPEMLRTWWMANLLAGNGNTAGLESYLGEKTSGGPRYFTQSIGEGVEIYSSGAMYFKNINYNSWEPMGGDEKINYSMGNISSYSMDDLSPYDTGDAANEVLIVYNTVGTYMDKSLRTSAPLPAFFLPAIKADLDDMEETNFAKANASISLPKRSLPRSGLRKGLEPTGTELPVPGNRLR